MIASLTSILDIYRKSEGKTHNNSERNKMKKNRPFTRIIILITILVLFIFSALVCNTNKSEDSIKNQNITNSTSDFVPLTEVELSPTQMIVSPTITVTPTIAATPTVTKDYITNLNVTLSATIGPVNVSTVDPNDSDYLYKNAIVTMKFYYIDDYNVAIISYINLDNLQDNGMKNSDIEFIAGGRDWWLTIQPTNNSYYLSTDDLEDYSRCVSHFPLKFKRRNEYFLQGYSFEDGQNYCILTSEGRIATLHYILGSKRNNGADSFLASVEVTVYSKKGKHLGK
jgi:hypothetical protein